MSLKMMGFATKTQVKKLKICQFKFGHISDASQYLMSDLSHKIDRKVACCEIRIQTVFSDYDIGDIGFLWDIAQNMLC